MKNVLVIGGTGFVGSNIVKKLLSEGSNVFILGSLRDKSLISTVRDFAGRLDDYDLIKKILIEETIDTVIHLASTLIPASSFDDFSHEMEVVIKPTMRLLPLFASANIKFIYFSSGGTIYGINESGVFSERDEIKPISYYGQSKLILEQSILLENRRVGLKYLIIRPSNPYGIGQNIYGKQGLIAASIGHVLNNEKITIWGDGKVIRDYIHIDDLAHATVKLIKDGTINEIYNIGSGLGYTVLEIIDFLKNCIVGGLEVVFLEGRSVDVPIMILDIQKMKDIVGENSISIHKGILDFYNYELSNKK